MSADSIWLVLCGAGAIQSVFLTFYLVTYKKISRTESLLLSTLFLAISLRLIKSIGWYFFNIDQIAFLNMGFVAHGFIGPLLVLYLSEKVGGYPAWLKILVLIPAIALLLVSPLVNLTNFWYAGGYHSLLYTTIAYVLWSAFLIFKISQQNKEVLRWAGNLFLGISLFCLAYFTNYILGLTSYISGPVIYSFIVYFISYTVFRNEELFVPKQGKKYKNLNLTEDQIERHKERVGNVMDEQKPYLDSDFSLSKLSELTSIPKHMLSRFFSENMNQNFSDFTNSYRVEEAKKLLMDEAHQNHKIAFIAYECGFNTLSSFNAAFKKFTEKTPSEFKNNSEAV